MVFLGSSSDSPSIAQQRAFAYAAKPFAILSFFSSLWIIYSLTTRRRVRKKCMYDRLILSAAFCITVLSFCVFWGAWAVPVGTPNVIGASGNKNTCDAQAFLWDWSYIAFPFYYASFSVLAVVSVKNNFKEESYAWMEKWIHIGAYVPPLIYGIVGAAKGWPGPGLTHCSTRYFHRDSTFELRKNVHIIYSSVACAELLVATGTITYLWINFNKMQKSIDAAIGMKKIREEARKQRTQDVAIQSGLYLISFWFMYLFNIICLFIYLLTDIKPYDLMICSNVVTASQGMILAGVYYGVRQKNFEKVAPAIRGGSLHSDDRNATTVSMIRAKAADTSTHKPRLSILRPISFRIFDGTPAENSPWATYFDDDIESFDDDDLNTQATSGRSIVAEHDELSTSLLK